jgi:hypothetical protein
VTRTNAAAVLEKTVRNVDGARTPYLYHYQSFDVKRLEPILLKSKLYFSKPSSFNDPWDCRLCYNLTQLGDATERARLAADFIRIDHEHNPGRPAEERRALYKVLANDAAVLEKAIRDLNVAMHSAIDEQYRIYSLASSPLTALMWSHYAEKHTGVCLEFVVDDRFFGAALQVEYATQYPSLAVFADGSQNLRELLVKSADWSYEAEYRMAVMERRFARPGSLLVVDDHWIQFPPPVLSAVIVGCQMSEQKREELRNLVSQSPSPIKLKQAIRHEDRYKLRLELL